MRNVSIDGRVALREMTTRLVLLCYQLVAREEEEEERTLSLSLAPSLTEFSSRMGRSAKNAESRYRESNGA